MKTAICIRWALFCSCLFLAVSTPYAGMVDLTTIDMTADSDQDTLFFSANGVNGRVRGYHVEITDSHPNGRIYGPFSTTTALDTPSWIYPYFGRIVKKSDGSTTGLMLLSKETLGQTDIDTGSASIEPTFDNRSYQTSTIPTFQFALFEFDTPVDVSQAVIGPLGSGPHPIWVAGSAIAPNLAADFLSAFSGFEFRNVPHTPSHTMDFATLSGIRYLAIGAPPSQYEGLNDATTFGPLNVVGDSHFYIDGLDITPVPLPPALWLFGSAVLLLTAGRIHR